MSAATISQEAMQKLAEDCKRNLLKFYYTFVALRFEDHCEAPHMKYLADKLTQCVYNPDFKDRLSIAMPPQHSKSSMVTVAFPLWLTIRNPKLRIFVVNAEKELSKTFGIQIRRLMQNIGHFYNMGVSNVQSSNTSLMFTKNGKLCDGSIKLTGISGGISGRPADIIIVDDPYKGLEMEFTPTALKHSWRDYSSLIEQRGRTNTKFVLLHTRWHSEDIQGRLLADDYQKSKYQFIELPAIAGENDILGRNPGEPLWPQYYGLEFYLDKQKTMGERQFQAIYQQKPLDLTSNFFHVDYLHFERRFDDYAVARCRSWDIASSDDSLGDERDYSVGVRMLKTPGDQYWIFDFERGQYGNNLKHVLKSTAQMDSQSHTILLETGAGTSDLLFKEYKDELHNYDVYQSKTKGLSKEDRATPLANAMFDGKIHICIHNDEKREILLSELKSFPNSKHDDCVDALAHGFNWLKQHGGNYVATANKRERRRLQ